MKRKGNTRISGGAKHFPRENKSANHSDGGRRVQTPCYQKNFCKSSLLRIFRDLKGTV
jgi:hypothetical protein